MRRDMLGRALNNAGSHLSVAEAELMLKEAGLLGQDDYARDRHFSSWIYEDLKTPEDVERFLSQLDDLTEPGPFRRGCTKAQLIRQYLTDAFWMESVDRMKIAISANRRACCSCHETGSYARKGKPK